MSLSRETIEHIEQVALTIAQKFNDAPTHFPTRTLPKDMVIHNLEKYQASRNHYRASMDTQSIADFVKYCEKHNATNCFIISQEMSAKTIFDIGTPELPLHCHHKAYLGLKKTAAYKALKMFNGSRESQRNMADWIEEWHDLITPLADDEEKTPISLAKAVNSIRKLTVEQIKRSDHEQGNFKAARTTLESIEAKADDLPGWLKFTCVPYEGLSETEFLLRLSIIKSHDEPQFVIRIFREEAISEELAVEFKEILTEKLPEQCETYIGELSV